MKRIYLLLIACFCFINAQAAYLKNIPVTVTQPDGTVLQCFASGDEYFNYLHDKDGFTIMQHPQTGYYVYAQKRDGKLVATDIIAGRQDPASKGLEPYALISPEEWIARRKAWQEPEKRIQNRSDEINHGTLNNIAIFIRFSDDEELANSYTAIDNMFNDVSDGAVSMRSYFKSASYGNIEIPTTFYPGHNGDVVISYQDTYPRSYFNPYSSTNTNGYSSDDDRTEREHALLERAVNYINENYPIPTSLNIDYDNDGYVDNVCFIVKGNVGGWNDLLWPHKWALYTRSVYINSKRVWTFNFQLADATSYFNTSTMCHEMNHSLGAPDLYHYYNGTSLSPVGPWDLMESNATPPQHCGAYMKMKYGHWVDDIPEITQPGVYTLNPISSDSPVNIAYKIASSDPDQFYVVEYRDKSSLFESSLPGSGLLIYRIDTRFEGNASYNSDNGIYDEVYLFRPGGNTSANGNLSSAYFSYNSGRTEFSSATNPYPFLSDGTIDNDFRIYDITSAGSTISFTYGGASTLCDPPTNVVATVNDGIVYLSWDAATNAQSYNVYRNGELIGNATGTTYSDNSVSMGAYSYYLKSVDVEGLQSGASETVTVSIVPDGYVFIGDGGSTSDDYLPSYSYYNYSLTQQIYTSEELGLAGNITSIAFYNEGAEKTRTLEFYMKNTTKNSFSDNTDWVSVTASDKVFSGSVTMKSNQWNTVTLSTPFSYDGTSNLILITDDNSGEWSQSPHMSCRVFTASNKAIRIYSDDVNFDPNSPSSYSGTLSSVKNQILIQKENALPEYVITVSANPSAGGTVSGGGSYTQGTSCTLSANANPGYTFVEWTKNGIQVSTADKITFIVTEDAEYVAVFTINSYEVTAIVNPTAGGTISGTGTYNYGTTCTLTATANQGYSFVNWTKDGEEVSTNAAYSFTVTEAAALVANFTLNSYLITATAIPADGGTVTISGDINQNDRVYDFEDGTTQGWTILQGTNGDSPNNWMHCTAYTTNNFTSGYGHNASNGFMLSESLINNGTPAHPDNYLISPKIQLGGSITFWASDLDDDYGAEHFAVAVSTNGNTDVNDFTTVEEWTLLAEKTGGTRTIEDGIWYEYTADLSAFSGMGYVAIHHFDCYDQWLLCIDDITITEGVFFYHGGSCTLTATANQSYNFVNWTKDGTEVSTNTTYSFIVTEAAAMVANFTINSYSVTATASPAEGGTVAISGDINQNELVYDFEVGTQGWTILQGTNGDSPNNWMHCTDYTTDDFTSGYGHNASNGFMLSESLIDNGDPVHPDNYLISPKILLGGSITFWASDLDDDYGAEHFAVAVSTNGNTDVNDFTTVEEWTLLAEKTGGTRTIENGVWYEYSADLSAFSGMGYVAIHHFNCYEQWLLCIDDITITEGVFFYHGGSCTLTATANEGYDFVGWMLNGNEVSTDATYNFTVTGSLDLVANFEESVTTVSQSVSIPSGWGWWSTNVEITLNDLETALGTSGTSIVSQNGAVNYVSGLGWDGNINEFDLSQMYEINVTEDVELAVSGLPANPEDHPVTIHNNWNWIGYPVQQSMSVNEALANLSAAPSDKIKSKNNGFATWVSNTWKGSLRTLVPGQGYMYLSKDNETKVFTYPIGSRGGIVEPNATDENNFWKANPERFANNMNMMAVVEIDGVEATNDDVEIGAFVDCECRGSIRLMYVEEIGRHLAFLTIHGETGEAVSFKVKDADGIRDLDERIAFQVNGMVGEVETPYVLHASSEELSLFPNPVNRNERVHVTLPASIEAADAMVEVYNALGALVGSFQLNGNSELEGFHVSGLYTVKVTDQKGNVHFAKLVVK